MDWFLQSRGKSVARNAQIVVKNMHTLLEQQNKRVKELESLVNGLQSLCTDSLEHEIHHLEIRKNDLLLELDTCESAILERRERLDSMKDAIKAVKREAIMSKLASNESSIASKSASKPTKLIKQEERKLEASVNLDDSYSDTREGPRSRSFEDLEDEYIEEVEMLATVKESILPSPLLFILHRNNVDEVIVYTPSANPLEIISSFKLNDINDKSSSTSLSSFDFLMGLGARIIPSHERELPDVVELPVPESLLSESDTTVSLVGHLIGAIEITVAQDVIIDIWKTPENSSYICWATTSVNGVQFSVLERIYITAEVNWGVPTITQIDLFARHPFQGHIIVESISAANY